MADEIPTAGYESLRALVNSSETLADQWDWIALIDSEGNEEIRVQISDDDRAEWTTSASDQTQTVEFTVRGDDSDIDTPVVITESALYTSDTATDAVAGPVTLPEERPIELEVDEITISHHVEVPEVV